MSKKHKGWTWNNRIKDDAIIYYYINKDDILQGSISHYKVEQLYMVEFKTDFADIKKISYKKFKRFKNVLHNEEWLG